MLLDRPCIATSSERTNKYREKKWMQESNVWKGSVIEDKKGTFNMGVTFKKKNIKKIVLMPSCPANLSLQREHGRDSCPDAPDVASNSMSETTIVVVCLGWVLNIIKWQQRAAATFSRNGREW